MRGLHLVTAGAVALGLAWSSNPAFAGALKVMNVNERGMVVLDLPTVQRAGDTVTAKILTVTNQGFQPIEYYESPVRSSISIACDAQTFSLNGGSVLPIAPDGAVAHTAGWLCKGIAPAHSTEAGYFGSLGRAYRAYVTITPGVFFVYNP